MTSESPSDRHPHLTIADTGTLRDAMVELRASGRGLLCVLNDALQVVGVITDGDIRNALLERDDMDAAIAEFMTKDFTYAYVGSTKEHILKLLDSRVRQVPILDRQRRLVDLAGAGYSVAAGTVYARAKAPARISLAGGGTDFTRYFMEHGGVSLSATIAKYSHVTVRRRADARIVVSSSSPPLRREWESIDQLHYGTEFDLIAATTRIMRPDFGFDLYYGCDYASGSGLGGSASLLSAVIGCLNEFRQERLDSYAIAEHAFDVERIELGFPGGWQDQYATVFGGLNYIEFNHEHNSVMPLRLHASTVSELEERLLLCHSGQAHLGRRIQEENSLRESDATMLEFGERAKEIAFAMRHELLRGCLNGFGQMLHETWELKKRLIPGATSEDLDRIYDTAMRAGADGGRLLGTGGGGYFLFAVPPFERHRVWTALEEKGLVVESVVLDSGGLKSWTLRD